MRVGFTGTREGMTRKQRDTFRQWVIGWVTTNSRKSLEFRHGACLGADATAADIVDRVWPVPITAHPSDLRGMTSENALRLSKTVCEPKPPLERNRDIVDACETLVAAPDGPEKQRSGTWATVRYARKQGKPIVIVWPDGTIRNDGD